MHIQVMIFGQLAEVTKTNTLTLAGITDTNGLVAALNKLYPALAGSKYIIAVNKQTINSNTTLNESSTVALLPPFSGG